MVSSSEGGETYAAYFYNSNRTSGQLYGLSETKVYTARWYNPLTGKFVQIADNIVPAGGEYKIPDKPTAGDWALLVTCLDLGEYETEEPYRDPLITESSNLALNAAAASSSYSMDGFTADKAVDGQSNTYWCASSGSFPQWLTVDLGEVREFDRIVMDMVPKTPACTYTVQASADGENWSSIYSGERETPVTAAGCARFMIVAGGKYRYIRVEFADIPGDNWAAVNELSVYLGQPEITGDTNLVLGAASKDSSHNSYEGIYTSAASVDGNRETYWCADGGAFPQWVKYDLGQTTDFNEISMAIHDYDAKYSFGIYGTNDAGLWESSGTDGWEEICSCDGEQPDGGRFDFRTGGASCRYLQIYFTGISDGHWAAVHEFEVYNRSEDETALPEFGGEKQEFGIYCTGSGVYTAEGDYSNTDVYLNDGDIATEWKPFAPLCTQTVMIDLNEVRRLDGIYITLGERAYLPQYRIYGSSDGENWTVLTDTTLRPAQSVKFSGRTVVCEELSGDWRYLKLLWLSGQDNAAIKSIAEIELYAEELPKPPIDPEYKLGDVDKNGTVNVSDIMTLKNLIMTGGWSDEQLRLGDMDKSNTLNVSDMLSIKSLIMAGG